MFDGTTFGSSPAECLPGDLFALLTDGLIEVFNRDRDELGFDWAKACCDRARVNRCQRSPTGCSRTHAPTALSSTIRRSC